MATPNDNDRPRYERPGLPWVCGHAVDGEPCPLGPSRLGVCGASDECRPALDEDSQRWVCTRPENRGGKCSEGPTPEGKCCRSHSPCSPARTLRGKRNLFTWMCTVLTVGVTTWMLCSRHRTHVLAPGHLSASHAQILTSSRHQQCNACHAAAKHGVAGWVAAIAMDD